jgi:2-dehydro-3-deoxyphosphogluconate aldolase/(4S)-4-hydroxy-2-oxoglutarate aldolase
LVAPGTNPKVVEHAVKRGVPITPGVATPSEIALAMSLGAAALKFFPAETMGGVAALKAFAGPFPDARFLPTGGITPELVPSYLKLKCVLACGGSWMAPREFLAEGRFDVIAALVEDAVKMLAGPPEIAT